jgi:hypothetical protein
LGVGFHNRGASIRDPTLSNREAAHFLRAPAQKMSGKRKLTATGLVKSQTNHGARLYVLLSAWLIITHNFHRGF